MSITRPDSGHWLSRPAVIASIGFIVVVAALVLALLRVREGEPPAPSSSPPTAVAPGPPASAPAEPVIPAFDVARISTEGNAVIAGRAAPSATITIESDGQPVGTVTADARGEWIFVPEAPLPPGAHRLTLSMRTAAGAEVAGEDEILIVVPETGKDIGGRAAPGGTQPMALLIPKGGEGAPRVLQKPGNGEAGPGLVLDAVEYTESGRLAVSGRATPGARIKLYIDDRQVGSAVASAEGRWSLTVKRLRLGGNHTLRAEQIDTEGHIAGRFSGRLLLAEPAFSEKTAPPADGDSIRIQPGHNLWRIARRTYGEGLAYTMIFEANRGQISDPDLIYPGQVLALPKAPPAARAE